MTNLTEQELIDRAIIDEFIAITERNLETYKEWRSKTRNPTDHNKTIRLYEILLDALREKRERMEGCEWCRGEHGDISQIECGITVECEECDACKTYCPNAHSSDDPCSGVSFNHFPVRFCPACGKKLPEGSEQHGT